MRQITRGRREADAAGRAGRAAVRRALGVAGDCVLLAAEVNPVIRALHAHGIQVTSLHGHMLTRSPRRFYLHFCANDDALTLARGLRAALDRTNSRRTGT